MCLLQTDLDCSNVLYCRETIVCPLYNGHSKKVNVFKRLLEKQIWGEG